MSDLHLECSDFVVEKNGDVLVLAGDIFTGHSAERFEIFLDRTMALGYQAVLFVLGNHEGYGWSISEAKEFLRTLEDEHDRFCFLDQDVVTIDGQRFVGATLWSNPAQNAHIQARLYINDYRSIRGWTIDDHVNAHWKDLNYLLKVIKEGDVVITHFPPTFNGVDRARFAGDVLNSWFVNDMNLMIREMKPKLWISGHTHHVWDEMVGVTRDVGNCRGYTRADHGTGLMVGEVFTFNPTRAIKIEITDSRSIGAAS
ncbi:hypothetical protein LCGC14_0372980 [marine sediment metagenome]|uniref:Calcineurin-like phosphoesterase domain-containing protein n=1 Tax=marine sediment metagenome TaxID=412755 RepID=A0A0F9WD07_9ZZZZ